MEYKEIISKYTFEQLVYEIAILKKEKQNLYIKEKELEEEYKRRKETVEERLLQQEKSENRAQIIEFERGRI